MANTYKYVSEQRLLYFTQQLKAKLGTSVTIDDTSTTATDKTWSTKKINEELKKLTGLQFAGPYTDYTTMTGIVTTPDTSTIYLVSKSSTTAPNIYDEYVWIKDSTGNSGVWELLGTTDIDLSKCVKTDEMVEITTDEIDTIMTTVFGASTTA